jgi:hypothetical protein
METLRVIDYPKDGVSLGQGWDSTRAARRDAIGIVFEEKRTAQGQTKTEDYVKATDSSRLMESMEISTDLQYAGIVGQASAKFSFASKVEMRSTSQCFVAKAKVENGRDYTAPVPEEIAGTIAKLFDSRKSLDEVQALLPRGAATAAAPLPEDHAPLDATRLRASHPGTVRLTPGAVQLAETDIDEFYRIYGDSFVSAIHSGAELVAVLVFDEQERTSMHDLEASMQGSGWGFSAKGGFKQKAESYASKNKLKVTYYQAGGSGDAIPTDVDGFLAKIAELPKLAQDAPYPFKITLQRYDTLPNWPRKSLPQRPSAYEQTIRRYFEYRSLYDDIDAVCTKPGDYLLERGTDIGGLRHIQGKLHAGIGALERALQAFDRKEGDLAALPPEASAPDYDFRVAMPIPRNYDASVRWDMDGKALRRLITEFWIEAPSRNRCSRSFSDPGCLSPKQIGEYSRQIRINYPVVVGGHERASSLDSKKEWVELSRWGKVTEHEVHVADFRTWSPTYGESQGTLDFFIDFEDEPGTIRGWREVVTSRDGKAPHVETVSWGSRKGLDQVEVADFRCWSAQYHEGHGHLYFYVDPHARPNVVRGGRCEVTSKDSKKQLIRKEVWGDNSGAKEALVASFRTWSREYGEGQGYLTFVLAEGR